MKQPVDHILRPQLPWRNEPGMTECGYDASKVPTLTRNEYAARLKELGQQRAAMLTCMTCASTSERWQHWEDDPRRALGREIEWETGGYGYRRDNKRGLRLHDELLAIAALVEAHREEFDAHVTATGQRRSWLERKAASAAKPKQKPMPGGL